MSMVSLDAIEAAQSHLRGTTVLRTPLVPLNTPSNHKIFLKLENLQPGVSCFKLRGAANAMATLPTDVKGVYTASAGNMGQAVAFEAQRRGLKCVAVVPSHVPETKLKAMQRFDCRVVPVPFDTWWDVILSGRYSPVEMETGYTFVHPVSNPNVMAGNGTIGLEILEDLPHVDAVIVPYGGGGLISGIGSAIKARKPDVKIIAAEVETAAPLTASLAAGAPRSVEYTASFVDGIGGKSVLEDMWPIVKQVVDAAVAVPLASVQDAVRDLATRNRVVAEGAGAAALAVARHERSVAHLGDGGKTIVCVVSGGNIDDAKLAAILKGENL